MWCNYHRFLCDVITIGFYMCNYHRFLCGVITIGFCGWVITQPSTNVIGSLLGSSTATEVRAWLGNLIP